MEASAALLQVLLCAFCILLTIAFRSLSQPRARTKENATVDVKLRMVANSVANSVANEVVSAEDLGTSGPWSARAALGTA